MSRARGFPGEAAFLFILVCGALAVGIMLALATGATSWLATYAMGVALICYALAILRRLQVVRRWPLVAAKVLESHVEDVVVPADGHGQEKDPEYRPAVLYQYGHHRAQRFGVVATGHGTPQRSVAKALADSYLLGADVTVRVCADDSSWSVLRTDLLPRRKSHTWAALCGGLLTVAISIFSALSYVA